MLSCLSLFPDLFPNPVSYPKYFPAPLPPVTPVRKKAAGRGLHVLRRSPEGGACEFYLVAINRRSGSITLQTNMPLDSFIVKS